MCKSLARNRGEPIALEKSSRSAKVSSRKGMKTLHRFSAANIDRRQYGWNLKRSSRRDRLVSFEARRIKRNVEGENREAGVSYLELSRSLSDRLLVRLTRAWCRGETGNYVWGSISGVVRRVSAPALAEFSVRKRRTQASLLLAVIKLRTFFSLPSHSSYLLLSLLLFVATIYPGLCLFIYHRKR